MKLPRPRFTLRWLMVTVAIVAIVLGGTMMWRRSAKYAARADFHRFRMTIFKDRIAELAATPPEAGSRAAMKLEQDGRLLHHYTDLAVKYERAARYPWLIVETDPPEPE